MGQEEVDACEASGLLDGIGAAHTDVADLCRAHASWAVDLTGGANVPRGWAGLLAETFDRLARVACGEPVLRLAVEAVVEHGGRLFMGVGPVEAYAGEEARLEEVRRIVAHARLVSASICRTCCGPAHRRVIRSELSLCDHHAADLQQSPLPASLGGRPLPFAIYDVDHVAAALGQGGFDPSDGSDSDVTGHQAKLRDILAAGEGARWRTLARPDEAVIDDLDRLDRRAPHMGEVTALVRRHLRAALATGRPTWFPPLMLVGEPGIGKTWYLSRLAETLRLPFRHHPINLSSLGEGLSGAHASWRNAQAGLVARTLLTEPVASPLILVDEVDKPPSAWREDPYRPLYNLLEPEGAKVFIDEYLQFPMDASAILWVLAGNSAEVLPEPIIDRLTIIRLPAMGEEHLRAVLSSVYESANAAHGGFFEPALAEEVVVALLGTNARGIRRAVSDAMARAASEGRRTVARGDVVPPAGSARAPMGFIRGGGR